MTSDGRPSAGGQTDYPCKTDNPIEDKGQEPLSQISQKNLQDKGSQQVGPKVLS